MYVSQSVSQSWAHPGPGHRPLAAIACWDGPTKTVRPAALGISEARFGQPALLLLWPSLLAAGLTADWPLSENAQQCLLVSAYMYDLHVVTAQGRCA